MNRFLSFVVIFSFLVALLPTVSASAKEKSGVEWTLDMYGNEEKAIAPSMKVGSAILACANITLKATAKNAKITKVTVAVKNSDDETVAKFVVKPKSENFVLNKDDICEKIPFKELKAGKYHYVVTVKVNSNKKTVTVVDEKFTVYSKNKANKLEKKILANAEAFLNSAGYKARIKEEESVCSFGNVVFQKNDGWQYVWNGSVAIDCGCIVVSMDKTFHLISIGTKDIDKYLENYLKE